MTGRGRGARSNTRGKSKPQPSKGSKKSLNFGEESLAKTEVSEEPVVVTDMSVNGVNSASMMITNGENDKSEIDTKMSVNSVSGPMTISTGATGTDVFVNKFDSTSQRPIKTTNMEGKSQSVSVQEVETGSRFQPLNNSCKYCDKVCIEAPGMFSENVVCTICKRFSHMSCEQVDKSVLIEQKKIICSYVRNVKT